METLPFRQPRIVALTLLVIVSAGLSALLSIGRQEDPTITNLFATITTPFPGADPARVEALVTAEIEDELRPIAEVDEIDSVSSTGISVISVTLVETLADNRIEQVWSEIRDAVDDAAQDFPAGVGSAEVNSDGAGTYAAIVALTATHDSVPLPIMARFGEDLADRLRNVPGTKLVDTFGTPEEEVLVSVDPRAAASLGLTADAIAARITAADAKVQSGRVRSNGTDMVLNLEGEIDGLARIAEIVLREDAAGRVVRVGDIASITRGPREPAPSIAIADGRPAVLIAARIADGQQVDLWMGDVRAALGAFEATVPDAIAVRQVFDQSAYTFDRLAEVGTNMAIGVALVVAVLFLTLGVRAALIVAMVLPIVGLATLATMNILGIPIHQMSVTGLIVALGLLVDAAIVMTDEIGRRLRAGAARAAAVGASVQRLFGPLTASTLTTALSFTPMILLPGPAGDFVGSIAMAVVIMLMWSLFVAITVTPAISGWLLPSRAAGGGWLHHGLRGGWLSRRFHATLRWSVANPVKSIALALVLPVTGFVSMPTLTAQFFPGVDRDQFYIEIETAPGSALTHTAELTRQMDRILRAEPDIDQVTWVVGESAPAFYYNIVGGREDAHDFAQALITSASAEATERLVPDLQARLDAAFPEARVLVRGLVQGPPVNAPVELRFIGPDLDVLRDLGDRARALAAELDSVIAVRSSLSGGAPKVSLDVDEPRARLLGLDLAGIARQLEAGLEGVTGGSMLEGTEQVPVRVRTGDALRGDLAAIADLPILPPDAPATAAAGRYPGVPLSALASLSLEPSESVIVRRNTERANTVQAFLAHGVLPEEALKDLKAGLAASGIDLPPGYRLEYGGDSDARSDTLNNLIASLGIIVTLSVATVVLTFNSFRLTAITLVVAGLSAGLSILALAVFQYPFGINAVIGVIGSIGVSINAAIIIMTGLQNDPAAAAGDRGAMADVVLGSSRHILSTTITTFGGFLPLILGGGGFWPPFAMSIAGGVLLSTVVSFYFTPAAYALVARRAKAAAQIKPLRLTPAFRPVIAAAE
ncbi:MAG: efflux RND transporter permease subunit [Pseudomonadota bacterium]